MKTIMALLISTTLGFAQPARQSSTSVGGKPYDIPFASQGNVIELSVANTSTLAAEGIRVEASGVPEGIAFKEKTVTLNALKSKEEQTASFTFSVEKTAKVNTVDTLRFTITDKAGQTWKKEITIKIAPPATYELFQNYPNPFNPTTVISYQLPGGGSKYIVTLKVYDLLGKEVATLVSEQQEPGAYQATFDARKFASGMYVYRLIAADDQNNHQTFQKKMLLVK